MFGDGKSKISGGYGIFYFVDRGGISNQLAQNPPFSGQVNYSFANGYRITFTGQAAQGTQDANGNCLTSCNPVGATTPLPSKGPIQVNLNNPAERCHLRCNSAVQRYSECSGVEPSVRAADWQQAMSFSLAYVGNKGTHLTTYYNYNRQQYNDPQCSVSNPIGCNFPALGAINTQATIGNSTYNSLQTSLET